MCMHLNKNSSHCVSFKGLYPGSIMPRAYSRQHTVIVINGHVANESFEFSDQNP